MSRTSHAWVLGWVLLLSGAAYAQQVVVLEFDKDKGNQVRKRVVEALQQAGKVELVPLAKFKEAAARKKVKGARAMTPAGVVAAARSLRFDLALMGSVGGTFYVRFLDPKGREIFKKDLPISKGTLPTETARKLAEAVARAAGVAPGEPAPAEPRAPSRDRDVAPAPEAEPRAERPIQEAPPRGQEEERPTFVPDSRVGERRDDEPAQTDIEAERDRRPRVGPSLVSFRVALVFNWRTYCARPGVTRCADYETLTPRPQGNQVSFSSSVPYAGFRLAGELFPLASAEHLGKGLGLTLGWARGFSRITVVADKATAEPTSTPAFGTDDSVTLQPVFRYYFGMGEQKGLAGYVGARGGLELKNFDVSQGGELPGAHRVFPAIGIDAAVPLAQLVYVEAAATLFVGPAPSAPDLIPFGTSVSSSGFGLEGGLATPPVLGPVGFLVRIRYQSFSDQFQGGSETWTDKGSAQETFTALQLGAVASF